MRERKGGPLEQPRLERPAASREGASGEDALDGEERARAPLGRREGGWRRWLSGASPREVLARIVPGDPLGLRALAARLLDERALLLDADRVHLAALARCARAAPRYRGHPELESWLSAILERTLDDLARESAPASRGARDAFDELGPPLGLEPGALRRATSAFHRLALDERRTFFELVLDGRALDDLARATGESASAVARRARRALLALLAELEETRAHEPEETRAHEPEENGGAT